MSSIGKWILWGLAAVLVAGFGSALLAAEPAVPATIDFNRDVRPILSDNCYFCHGPDKNKRKADLRLDTKAGIFSVIEDRHTVVPGKPAESELYRLVIESDPETRMPDPKSNKKLSEREIAVLKKVDRAGGGLARTLGLSESGEAGGAQC
jgi:hypothetical protein